MRWSSPLALTALLLVACNSDPAASPDTGTVIDTPDTGVDDPVDTGIDAPIDTGVEGPRYTWWDDVEPIVSVRCQTCHADPPQFGAPRPFVEYSHTQEELSGAPLHEVMVFRIYAEQNRMPPSSQPQLTDEEKEIIRIWSEIGAPEGTRPNRQDAGVEVDSGIEPDAGTGPGRNISFTYDILATNPGGIDPYELPVDDTNYRCWAFDVPAEVQGTHYAFRFEPLIDNTVNTHHTLLFHKPNAGEDTNGSFGCGSFPLSWTMIAGWAPGRGIEEIPEGAGVPLQAGEQLILQVHYDNVDTAGTFDNSGVRVLLSDENDLTPAGMLWSGYVWNNDLDGPNESRQGTCTITQDLTMFAVFPHMHKFGTRITLEVQRAGESNWTSLVDIPGWSFEDQPNIAIPESEQMFGNGDRLRTTCYWNTQGQSVPFGEASDDEMCFNFVYHYPKVSFDFACVDYGL